MGPLGSCFEYLLEDLKEHIIATAIHTISLGGQIYQTWASCKCHARSLQVAGWATSWLTATLKKIQEIRCYFKIF